MVFCGICGRESEKRVCTNCQYFLDNGSDEETIKKMLSDDNANRIWKANNKYAEELGDAYYESVIENYKKTNDSKENFGYNTFIDGIRLGLDIIIPLLDDENQKMAIKKIKSMVKIRKKR